MWKGNYNEEKRRKIELKRIEIERQKIKDEEAKKLREDARKLKEEDLRLKILERQRIREEKIQQKDKIQRMSVDDIEYENSRKRALIKEF